LQFQLPPLQYQANLPVTRPLSRLSSGAGFENVGNIPPERYFHQSVATSDGQNERLASTMSVRFVEGADQKIELVGIQLSLLLRIDQLQASDLAGLPPQFVANLGERLQVSLLFDPYATDTSKFTFGFRFQQKDGTYMGLPPELSATNMALQPDKREANRAMITNLATTLLDRVAADPSLFAGSSSASSPLKKAA